MMNVRTVSTPTYATIAVLVAVAAGIHFFRAVVDPDIRVLFVLNGLGFLALGAGVLLVASPRLRRWSRRILIGYAGVTVALYLVWAAMSGDWVVPWGPLAGAAELLLIWLLVGAGGREASTPQAPA